MLQKILMVATRKIPVPITWRKNEKCESYGQKGDSPSFGPEEYGIPLNQVAPIMELRYAEHDRQGVILDPFLVVHTEVVEDLCHPKSFARRPPVIPLKSVLVLLKGLRADFGHSSAF